MYAPEELRTPEDCDAALEHFYNKYENGKINGATFSIIQKVIREIRTEMEA